MGMTPAPINLGELERLAPVRVKLSRQKGWRIPPNTVRVCRPTIYGNPFTVEEMGRHDAVEAFRRWATGPLWEEPECRRQQMQLKAAIERLRGKNVACWCRLDAECHGDVLLELANAPATTDGEGSSVGTKSEGRNAPPPDTTTSSGE